MKTIGDCWITVCPYIKINLIFLTVPNRRFCSCTVTVLLPNLAHSICANSCKWIIKSLYFSYSGHSACVCLLSKIFSVQGKPFHFLSALTSTFACNFHSGDLSALACIRKKIVLSNRCIIGCGPFCSSMYTFRSSKFIFRNFGSTETR